MYCNGEINAVLFDLDDTLVNSKKQNMMQFI